MIWLAFLLGFFAHASLVMLTRNRQRADVDTTLPTAWQRAQWRKGMPR